MYGEMHFGVLKKIPLGYGVLKEEKLGTTDIDDATRLQNGKFYAVFIGYKNTFHLLDRQMLTKKLGDMLGVNNLLVTV
jgi:hypothetical protein